MSQLHRNLLQLLAVALTERSDKQLVELVGDATSDRELFVVLALDLDPALQRFLEGSHAA